MSTGRNPLTQGFAVTSKDGVTIAGAISGQGPPVVLVHGTTGSDYSWALVQPYLADRFTVYAIQRRGRGQSGDGPTYAIEREAEDIVAVVDSIGKPAGLVGHSFGANCCLEAALLTTNVTHLVLYEPVIDAPVDESLLERVDALIADGSGEAAVMLYLRESAGLSEEEIAAVRSSPTWEMRVAAAHTISREDRAAGTQSEMAARVATMTTPTLLLTGSESPLVFRKEVEALCAMLPHCALHVLEGQGHGANVTAPELLAREIIDFVHGSVGQGGVRA